MPRTTTKQKAQEPDPNDILSPPDDGIDPALRGAANDDDGPQDQSPRGGRQSQAQPEPEDRLGEITKLYRQVRDAAKKGAAQGDEDDDGDDGDDGDLDGGESPNANQGNNQRTNKNQPPQNNLNQNDNNEPEDPITTLKVDGVEIQLPLSKVKELAQKNIAGENRLEYAQRILKDAKAFRDQVSGLSNQRAEPEQGADQSQTPSQTDPASAQDTTNQSDDLGIDRAKLAEVVERIQVGDLDAGVEAVTDLIRAIQANRPALDEQTVFNLAQRAIVQQQIENEITTAVDKFTKDFESIATDKYRRAAAMARLTDELVADLRSAGVTDQEMASVRYDPRILGHWLGYARMQKRPVRSFDQLLKDVGSFIAEQFKVEPNQQQNNPPAGSQHSQQQQQANDASQQRLERKQTLQSQPRSASLRVQMQNPNQRPRTALDIVMEMRKARGFTD